MRSKKKRLALLHFLLLLVVSAATAENVERRQCPTAHAVSLGGQPVYARRSPARRAVPLVGEKHQLVILVAFPDKSFKDDNPLALWNDIFNREDYREGNFHGSVHDYFYDQSYGRFSLSFDLHMATVDSSYTHYGGKNIYGTDEQVGALVVDAVKKIQDEVSDWSVYDWDDDGYIDQVFVLYAGRGQNDGGANETIWPEQWSISGEDLIDVYSVDSRYKVDKFGCFAELDGYDSYGTFGTLCHEYGHCLGLPDFYYGINTSVVGAWDVMDYGLYNDDGFCPAGYTAHERMMMGWLEPTELTEPATVSGMQPVNEQAEAYLIRNDAYADEYYVVENRQKTGWDSYLPGSGLLVFHVDYNEYVWHHGTPNSSGNKRYTIVPANGNASTSASASWTYPSQTRDSLTNLSVPAATLRHPNSDGSYYLSKPLTHMQVTDGRASFDFMGGSTAGIALHQVQSRPQVLYEFGLVSIVRCTDGRIKKVVKH